MNEHLMNSWHSVKATLQIRLHRIWHSLPYTIQYILIQVPSILPRHASPIDARSARRRCYCEPCFFLTISRLFEWRYLSMRWYCYESVFQYIFLCFSLLDCCLRQAVENVGMAMGYTIAECLKEWLADNNVPSAVDG